MKTELKLVLEKAIEAAMTKQCEKGRIGVFIADGTFERMSDAAALVYDQNESTQERLKKEELLK